MAVEILNGLSLCVVEVADNALTVAFKTEDN